VGKPGNSNTSGGITNVSGATALNLDVKGRLAVPTRHRDGLQSGDGSKQVLTAHPHRCLLLYPAPAWEPIRAQIMGFSSFDPQTSLWKRLLVGFARKSNWMPPGGCWFHRNLRKFAGLEKQVMMVGQGSHFEIWSQSTWEKTARTTCNWR